MNRKLIIIAVLYILAIGISQAQKYKETKLGVNCQVTIAVAKPLEDPNQNYQVYKGFEELWIEVVSDEGEEIIIRTTVDKGTEYFQKTMEMKFSDSFFNFAIFGSVSDAVKKEKSFFSEKKIYEDLVNCLDEISFPEIFIISVDYNQKNIDYQNLSLRFVSDSDNTALAVHYVPSKIDQLRTQKYLTTLFHQTIDRLNLLEIQVDNSQFYFHDSFLFNVNKILRN